MNSNHASEKSVRTRKKSAGKHQQWKLTPPMKWYVNIFPTAFVQGILVSSSELTFLFHLRSHIHRMELKCLAKAAL